MNEEEMNRFARGELSPEEARALAQRALDDPDLFDELTALSVGREGLSPKRRKRLVGPGIALTAAAAAVVLLAVAWPMLRRPGKQTTMATVDVASKPVLLARAGDASSNVFRGADHTQSREPRPQGSVISVEEGLVSINLGSVDGLTKGGQVEVIRNGQPAGSITLATIFRERARGNLSPGLSIQAGDEVRVPDPVFLGALLDQIDAFSARGDSVGALRIADQAAHLAAESASTDYADLNNLAVIAELRGDKAKAEALYVRALSAGPPDAARKSIDTNLARVKGVK